jgi:hypothetical protein
MQDATDHRGSAEFAYLRQQSALALGGAYDHRIAERVPAKAGILAPPLQRPALLRRRCLVSLQSRGGFKFCHRHFGLGIHSGDGAAEATRLICEYGFFFRNLHSIKVEVNGTIEGRSTSTSVSDSSS